MNNCNCPKHVINSNDMCDSCKAMVEVFYDMLAEHDLKQRLYEMDFTQESAN